VCESIIERFGLLLVGLFGVSLRFAEKSPEITNKGVLLVPSYEIVAANAAESPC